MGKWTVFGGEPPKDPLGYYDSYSDAINAGYGEYKLKNFMVHKITPEHKIWGRWGAPKIATGLLAKFLKENSKGSLSPLIPPRSAIP